MAFMRKHIIESRNFFFPSFFPSSFFPFLANVCIYFLTFSIQPYEVESVINLLDYQAQNETVKHFKD